MVVAIRFAVLAAMLVALVAPAGSTPAEFSGDELQDHFWVECSMQEAAELCSIAVADEGAPRWDRLPGNWRLGQPEKYFTFLVSRDGRSVREMDWVYPVSNMWNAYNPFRRLPKEYVVEDVASLRFIDVPEILRVSDE